MLDQSIHDYATEKGFHKQTIERWLRLDAADRQALWDLVKELRMGENHLRDFLDWLEEIALRDGITFSDILKGESVSRILSAPRLGRNDKLKQLKEDVCRLRFPRLAQIEGEIEKKIRDMKLKPQIHINVPPGLEGGTLTVQLKAADYEELKRLVRELGQALEGEALKEIFALVRGESALPSSLPSPRRGEGEVEGA